MSSWRTSPTSRRHQALSTGTKFGQVLAVPIPILNSRRHRTITCISCHRCRRHRLSRRRSRQSSSKQASQAGGRYPHRQRSRVRYNVPSYVIAFSDRNLYIAELLGNSSCWSVDSISGLSALFAFVRDQSIQAPFRVGHPIVENGNTRLQ